MQIENNNILIYEPDIFNRTTFIKEIMIKYNDKDIIIFKESDSFIPEELKNLHIQMQEIDVLELYKKKILIFFSCHSTSMFNNINGMYLSHDNTIIVFPDNPFVITDYLYSEKSYSTNRNYICLFKDSFYFELFSSSSFLFYKTTDKFIKEMWKEFLEKNSIKSNTLNEYLDFLFENEVFEFVYFKNYLEFTYKKSFEYSLELNFSSNKITKLIKTLEETIIPYCAVRNSTVASIIEGILESKEIETKVKLISELEEVNEPVIYFDFYNFLPKEKAYFLLPIENKNYYLAIVAKENLILINSSGKKLYNYFIVQKLTQSNSTFKNSFIRSNNLHRFIPMQAKVERRENKSFYKSTEEGREKRIKNEFQENEIFKNKKIQEFNGSNEPITVEVDKELEEKILNSLNGEIRHIKTFKDKTILQIKCSTQIINTLEVLYAQVNQPIIMKDLPEKVSPSRTFIYNMKFGSAVSPSYFVDFYFLQGSGNVTFNTNGLTITYNAPTLMYRIEINKESIDDKILVSYESDKLNLTLLLKKYDRIFIKENTYFWKRASIKEVTFITNKFDLQFQIEIVSLFKFFSYLNNFTFVFNPMKILTANDYLSLMNYKYFSLKSIRKFFTFLSHEEFYYLECFITQKGRFLNYNLTESDLMKIKQSYNFIALILKLDSELQERFMNLSQIIDKNYNLKLTYEKSHNLIKIGYITPLKIVYAYPIWSDSNRILREFMLDKFIRYNFREEDCNNQIMKRSEYDSSLVFDYFRKVLQEGIYLGKKKYFFLAMSSSQLRQHSCLFMTPYFNTTLIGPDYIRSWMGDFSSVHNIGKCAARLGQCLSTTVPTLKVQDFTVEEDLIVKNYNFTDGIGKISFSFAQKVATKLRLNFVPSAFQIRFAGFKGVLALCNIKEEIVLRESMKKFESSHRILEVILFSQRKPCFLNRQVVLILESLGIHRKNFIKFSDLTLQSTVLEEKDSQTFIKNVIDNSLIKTEETEGKFLLDVKDKCRMFVNRGRTLIGVIDELGILEENEVFMMSRLATEDIIDDSVEIIDNRLILTDNAFVAKNPCLHPGDIRIVKGVNRKELYHYKEVLVFSKKGKRPIFNMCSGSDLDGDLFIISWEKSLIPLRNVASDEYSSGMFLFKEIISISDIINFFVKYMHEDQIGLIANTHLTHSDIKERGVTSPESMRLAELFNMGIDFPKTGYIASLPYDLVVNEVPDFLSINNNKTYLSHKTIGIIYRRSCHLIIEKELLCECKKCMIKLTNEEHILFYACKFRRSGIQEIYQSNTNKFNEKDVYKLNTNEGNNQINNNHNENNNTLNEDSRMNNIYDSTDNNEINKQLLGTSESEEINKIKSLNNKENEIKEIEIKTLKYVEENKIKKYIKNNVYYSLVDLIESFNKENSLLNIEKYSNYLKEIPGTLEEKYQAYSNIPIQKHSYFDFLFFSCFNFNEDSVYIAHKYEAFIFHDKILLADETDNELIESNEYFLIQTDISRNTNLKMMCPIDSVSLFNELFLLLLAGDFLRINEFNYIFSFFEFVIDLLNNQFTKLSVAEILFSISGMYFDKDKFEGLENDFINFLLFGMPDKPKVNRNELNTVLFLIEQRSNILLLISYLLTSEIPLKFKVKIMKHFASKPLYTVESKEIKVKEKIHVKYFNEIIVVGMFDSNDEVFLKEENKRFYLNLLNRGKSTLHVYKDNIRAFIVGHSLSTSDSISTVTTPGYLYFYDLSIFYKCNNFKLKKLRDVISFDKRSEVNASFINDSPLFYESMVKEYLMKKEMELLRENDFIRIEFVYRSNNYIVLLNSKLYVTKVSLNKRLLGRIQILNEGKDCNLEIFSEKVLLNQNSFTFNDDHLKDELSFIIKECLIDYNKNTFKLNDKLLKKEITDLYFYTITIISFSNKRSIQELVFEKKYNDKYEEVSNNSYVKSERMLNYGNCDYNSFEPYFMKVWDDLLLFN